MIDLAQAVKVARQAALDVLEVRSTTIEEIERHTYRGTDVWSITLGFSRRNGSLSAMAQLTASPIDYKVFLIDADTGEFLAMKMREPVSA